jgi:hypothetical protein
MKQLVKEKELLQVVRIPSRQLRDLRKDRKIPFLKIGSKTILYDVEKIIAALEKYERLAAGD